MGLRGCGSPPCRLSHQTLRPSDRGDRKHARPQARSRQTTQEESSADVRAAGGERTPWAPAPSTTRVCGCVNVPARPSIPASPRPLHAQGDCGGSAHPLHSAAITQQKLVVADPMGEEWVLPAGPVPLAGADRKIRMLLMSSQRKPSMDKKVVVFLPSPFVLPGGFK